MSRTLTKHTVRLLAIVPGTGFAEEDTLLDAETGQVPRIPRGNATDFQLGVFDAVPGESAEVNDWDLSNVATLTLEILPSQTTSGELVDKSVAAEAITAQITAAEWLAGTKQHATFSCSNAEMNLSLSSAAEANFWMVVTAILDDGSERTLAAGTVTFVEDQNASGGTPPANPGNTLSSEAITALVNSVAGVMFTADVEPMDKTPDIAWPDAPLASPPSVVGFTLETDEGIRGDIEPDSIDENGFTIRLSSSDHTGLTAHVHYKM